MNQESTTKQFHSHPLKNIRFQYDEHGFYRGFLRNDEANTNSKNTTSKPPPFRDGYKPRFNLYSDSWTLVRNEDIENVTKWYRDLFLVEQRINKNVHDEICPVFDHLSDLYEVQKQRNDLQSLQGSIAIENHNEIKRLYSESNQKLLEVLSQLTMKISVLSIEVHDLKSLMNKPVPQKQTWFQSLIRAFKSLIRS